MTWGYMLLMGNWRYVDVDSWSSYNCDFTSGGHGDWGYMLSDGQF